MARARTLTELRRRYVEKGRPLPVELENELRADSRAGARAILEAVERRRHDNRSEGQRLRKLLRYEQALWSAGTVHIAGVDEAGMSPLAGPVVAAAVILPVNCHIPGVDDSKKLDPETRGELAPVIKQTAVAWAVGMVDPEEIDRINIYRAGLLAMLRAVQGLGVPPQALLIDARRLRELDLPQQAIIKGDEKSLSIGAASIIAKTTRDALMAELDATYPGYGFAKHKGYPVKEHQDALERLGACAIHRRSFAPVRKALGLEPVQGDMFELREGTELPTSDAEYRALIDRFEAKAIPRGSWHHAQHVAVAFWYLAHMDEAAAIERIRLGIQNLNAANGVPQTRTGGYHETWTIFFAKLLRHFVQHEVDRSLPLTEQMEAAVQHFADFRAITRAHYSSERIDSWEARTTWVEPDLQPLP